MENKGFERFSKAWKKSGLADSTEKKYVENDIKLFKMKKSKDFSTALNNTIIFDLVHKSILIVGMLLLIWFYRSDALLITAFVALIGVSIYLLIKENGIKNDFQKIEDYTAELSVSLSQKLDFYKSNFPSLRWMLAFTNGLLVWVGSLFYFYSKYGYYRVEDMVDILVNFTMVALAFGISYFANNFLYKFNITEMEENLADLDDQAEAILHIQTQKLRKRGLRIGLAILVSVGILLFIYLVLSYMQLLG